MFQGNHVRDESADHAIFAELGSSPASMEAGKIIDVFEVNLVIPNNKRMHAKHTPKLCLKGLLHGSGSLETDGQNPGPTTMILFSGFA